MAVAPYVEIVLNASSRKYSLLPLNIDTRGFFPGYKIPFTLETDIGNLEAAVTGHSRELKRAISWQVDTFVAAWVSGIGSIRSWLREIP